MQGGKFEHYYCEDGKQIYNMLKEKSLYNL